MPDVLSLDDGADVSEGQAIDIMETQRGSLIAKRKYDRGMEVYKLGYMPDSAAAQFREGAELGQGQSQYRYAECLRLGRGYQWIVSAPWYTMSNLQKQVIPQGVQVWGMLDRRHRGSC
jgi:hypothetical protein